MTCVHVCLISDQLLPNLIPALAERPRRVYLVTSGEMAGRNQHMRLTRILRERGIDTELCGGAPSGDLPQIGRWAVRLCARLVAEEPDEIVLNATGGTKLLALGCVEAFRQQLEGRSFRIIYTDTAHQTIETIVPAGTPPAAMRSVLDVPSYLAAQGMRYRSADSDDETWCGRATQRRLLSSYLAEHATELGGFFGALNRLIHGTGDTEGALSADGRELLEGCQRFEEVPRGEWRKALCRIQEKGLVAASGHEIRFRHVDAARYLGGRWLEEYVWLTARDCALEDARCGVEGEWESGTGDSGPRNEFDLLAVHANRMLLVECKTMRMDAQGESAQSQIAKLDSLGRSAGGLFGTSLLLSARPLSPFERRRCKLLRIPLRETGGLRHLSEDLCLWKKGSSIPPLPKHKRLSRAPSR